MTWLTLKPERMIPGSMPNEINQMFDSFFSNQAVCHPSQKTFWPAVDIHESDNEIRLTLEAPGANKEDIKVTVKDRILSIEGKREIHNEQEDGNCLVNEIRSGSFSRKFTLPKTVDTEKIKADFEGGLLKVRLAKLEEIKPKEIDISIK